MPKRVLVVAVMFLASVVLTPGGAGVSSAAGKQETAKTPAVLSQEQKQVFDAHATAVRYHFQDPDMDFTFGSLVLGAAVNHGCEIGEAFRTAAHIKDGDAASWQEEWAKTAGLVAARGERSLARGHRVSARDQFQRASYYYRLALLAMLPADPRLKEYAGKSRALLKKAGALFDPPLEYFEIPFEGTVLPGFFRKARKAAAGAEPAKTLIMIGGGETFAEDLVFYIAPQAFERGYNFLTVDLPGQGLLPLEGKIFRPDMQVPLKAVVDYALGRPEVDPQRLAVYGYSGGGGFVPQAAMHDQRIKAIVMNACVVDTRALFATMPALQATKQEMASWSSFHGNTIKMICWRWGLPLDQPARLVEANRGFSFDPAKVKVPALIVVGEGEYQSREIKRQQQLCLDRLPNPRKKLVVAPAREGAAHHCVMENRSLMSQIVFDWLDEIFQETQPKQHNWMHNLMNWILKLITCSAFWSALTTTGIFIAALQFRFKAWLELQKLWVSEEFRNERKKVFERIGKDNRPENWGKEEKEVGLNVCRKIDEFVRLAPYLRLLPYLGKRKMLKLWGKPLADSWEVLKLLVIDERKDKDWKNKWDAFASIGRKALRNQTIKDRARKFSYEHVTQIW